MGNFLPEFVKLAKKAGMTPEQYLKSMSIGAETVNTKGNTIAPTAEVQAKLENAAKATVATAVNLSPEELVIKTLKALVKEGEYEVREAILDPTTGKQKVIEGKRQWRMTGKMRPLPKGLNAKIDLNPVLREAYGSNFDCQALTNSMVEKGLIVKKPIHGSVMFYLPGNVRESSRKSRLAEVLAHKG